MLWALHFSWSFFAVEMRAPVSDVLSRYWTIVTPVYLSPCLAVVMRWKHVVYGGRRRDGQEGTSNGKDYSPPSKACSTTSTRSLEPRMTSVESVTRYSE